MNLIFFLLQKFAPFSIFRIPGVVNRRVTNEIPIFSVSYEPDKILVDLSGGNKVKKVFFDGFVASHELVEIQRNARVIQVQISELSVNHSLPLREIDFQF